MRDYAIELTVNTKPLLDAFQNLSDDITRMIAVPYPDYGSDDLHNARLLGAYHVRRGWGDPAQTLRWVRSLSLKDERFIERYEKVGLVRGEWGRTELDAPQSPNIALVGLGAAASRLAAAVAKPGQAMARGVGPAADDPLSYFDGSGSLRDFDDILITVERINLRQNLQRAFVPAPVACLLARRWPAWALPAVAWVRLRGWWEGVRHARFH